MTWDNFAAILTAVNYASIRLANLGSVLKKLVTDLYQL
jgi:hypothetical protein